MLHQLEWCPPDKRDPWRLLGMGARPIAFPMWVVLQIRVPCRIPFFEGFLHHFGDLKWDPDLENYPYYMLVDSETCPPCLHMYWQGVRTNASLHTLAGFRGTAKMLPIRTWRMHSAAKMEAHVPEWSMDPFGNVRRAPREHTHQLS